MGKLRPRYNEKTRAGSHLAKTAKPHPSARDGGLKQLARKRPATTTQNPSPALPPAVSSLADDGVAYNASSSSIPDIIMPNDKARTLDTTLLPEEPTGKMTSKKKKRLEKFIEKQIKKDERINLLQRLSETTFSSGLLRSSKAFGQKKLTARERMRQALLEERAGIASSDADASGRLVVEKDAQEYEEDEDEGEELYVPAGAGSADDGDDFDDGEDLMAAAQPSAANSSLGLVGQAFGQAVAGPADVQVFGEHTRKEEAPVVFGGALKRKADDAVGDTAIPKRKKKKQQKKKAAPMVALDSDLSNSDLDDTDDEAIEQEKEEEVVQRGRKDIWAADVVDGESLPAPAPSKKNAVAPTMKAKGPRIAAQSAFHVPVNRPESIQLARISLPVVMEEQPIMEAIFQNDVTILCGETGSGKTTQVPQFLYESGFGDPEHPQFPGMVGITQPRRVAAVSMAQRVADEMALKSGEVAYQIRYDKGGTGKNTRIKFMTDGILLRELSVAAGGESHPSAGKDGPPDMLLQKYSCIIIDEAHERTIGTDVLIGWLTRVVSLRNSGKDFTMNETLFPVLQRPPVVKVDGRQHKVVIHYNKKTPEIDYGSEALKKITKIHTQLPPGGILVFMTGQQEIQVLVRNLRKAFPLRKAKEAERNGLEEHSKPSAADRSDALFGEADETAEADVELGRGGNDDYQEEDGSDSEGDSEEEDVDVLGGLSGDEDDELEKFQPSSRDEALPLHVLPLYSLLPTAAQMRVFESPPPGTRLVVVAINVAETSLTIPGIKYVVDCGKVKERKFDSHSGVQTYQVCWTSRVSADQRAGRAGRVGPGHCYRLFSSAVFNYYFEQFSQPEILRIPIEGVVLSMKSMGINNVVGFPFPTPPGKANLRAAEKLLTYLGAVDHESNTLKITELGRVMSKFPVSPRYAKMVIVAASQPGNILAYVIAIVSGLSVGDPFIRDEDIIGRPKSDSDDEDVDADEKDKRSTKRASFYKTMLVFSGNPSTSDALRLLTAIGAHTAESNRRGGDPTAFCDANFLRPKAMEEMRKLRQQLTNLVKLSLSGNNKLYPAVAGLCVDPGLPPPSARDSAAILQVILAGFADRVAQLDEATNKGYAGQKYVPVYRTLWGGKEPVGQIHPSSCLNRERPAPRFVVYEELVGREERMAADNSGVVATRLNAQVKAADGTDLARVWLKGVSAVDAAWIAPVAPRSLCRTGKVVDQPEPRWDPVQDRVLGFCVPTYGPKMWELPTREVELPRLDDRCRWLARSLIEGKIPLMAPPKELLVARIAQPQQKKKKAKKSSKKNGPVEIFPPLFPFLDTKTVTITKPWGQTQQKVSTLVAALVSAQVDTREKLLAQWRKDPKFLLTSYLLWAPDAFHAALSQYWPPAALIHPDDDDDERDAIRCSEMVRSVSEMADSGAGSRKKASTAARAVSDSDGDSDY
ncbi:ATP-dependent RNA helicase dhx37 [Thoreauomyces humboldtii]|nr:ATP-dependent RNA helicase dhx37 [Thoreauomyces humboldtii]